MDIYEQLTEYATQLTGDREIADLIAREAIQGGSRIAIDTLNADEAIAFMIVETRNKCYDHMRLNKKPG